jgi:hypothetical protein
MSYNRKMKIEMYDSPKINYKIVDVLCQKSLLSKIKSVIVRFTRGPISKSEL